MKLELILGGDIYIERRIILYFLKVKVLIHFKIYKVQGAELFSSNNHFYFIGSFLQQIEFRVYFPNQELYMSTLYFHICT